MKATIENGELAIRLPLNKTPVLSTSGKTLAALKQQRRHNRALHAAMDSLRNLRLER